MSVELLDTDPIPTFEQPLYDFAEPTVSDIALESMAKNLHKVMKNQDSFPEEILFDADRAMLHIVFELAMRKRRVQ